MKACFVMLPISDIYVAKDTTLALMLAAQDSGWEIDYMQQEDLFVKNGRPYGYASSIKVYKDFSKWFELDERKSTPLVKYDVIFMRVDPPVNSLYVHTTQLLDLAVQRGVLVTNPPSCLRNLNEKIFPLHFPDIMPPHLLSSNIHALTEFQQEMKEVVLKPLDHMGGKGIFLIKDHDLNLRSVLEELTMNGREPIIAQQYLPEILTGGDRRVYLFNGEPYPRMLVRLPQKNDFRANLAAGGSYRVEDIGKEEQDICVRIAQTIKEYRLLFVGLDIIGGKLTEINITSPTGLVETATNSKEEPAYFFINLIEELCTKK